METTSNVNMIVQLFIDHPALAVVAFLCFVANQITVWVPSVTRWKSYNAIMWVLNILAANFGRNANADDPKSNRVARDKFRAAGIMLVLLVAGLFLGGCQGLYYGHITKVKVEPMELKDGSLVCCKGMYVSGKEFRGLDVKVVKTSNQAWTVRVTAGEVKAAEVAKIVGDTNVGIVEKIIPGID